MIKLRLEKDGQTLLLISLRDFVMYSIMGHYKVAPKLPMAMILETDSGVKMAEVIEEEEVEDDNG